MPTPTPTTKTALQLMCGEPDSNGNYKDVMFSKCCNTNLSKDDAYICQNNLNNFKKTLSKASADSNEFGNIINTVGNYLNRKGGIFDSWAGMVTMPYTNPITAFLQGMSPLHEELKDWMDEYTFDFLGKTSGLTQTEIKDLLKKTSLEGRVKMVEDQIMEYEAKGLYAADAFEKDMLNLHKALNDGLFGFVSKMAGGIMIANMLVQASNSSSWESAAEGGAAAGAMGHINPFIGAGVSVGLWALGIGEGADEYQKLQATLLNKNSIDYIGTLMRDKFISEMIRDGTDGWPREYNITNELYSYLDCEHLSTSDCTNGTLLRTFCTQSSTFTSCPSQGTCKTYSKCTYIDPKYNYQKKFVKYYKEYLTNLKYNSDGELISPPYDDLAMWIKLQNELDKASVRNSAYANTRFGNFIIKYTNFIIFMIVFICIFAYILKYKFIKKKNA